MSRYREMVDDCKELIMVQVAWARGGALVPMVHIALPNGECEAFAASEAPADIAVAVAQEFNPEVLAVTFEGARGRADGFFEHDVAAVVVIDRERIEVWEARLVRHPDQAPGASLGAWRPWPLDAAAGKLTTPIQEAMRGNA